MKESTAVMVRITVVVCLVGTTFASVGDPVAGAATAGSTVAVPSAPSVSDQGGSVSAATNSSATNNTTIAHQENPRHADDEGKANSVEAYLAQRLAGRLRSGAVKLNQGQYRTAQSLLGDDYSGQLGKYVDLADQTGREKSAAEFRDARRTQREYTSTVHEYRQTYEEYRKAKRNGDEDRARQLGRKLNRLARESNRSAARLNESYATLGNQTGANFGRARTAVDGIQNNVTARQTKVQSAEFVATHLSVTTNRSAVSFLSPAGVRGRLVTENGTPVSNQQITLRVGNRTVSVQTNESGGFSFEYRPTTLPLSAETVPVGYVPNNESKYLSSNASLDLSAEQVNGTITVDGPSSTVRFGDRVTAKGRLSVQDHPVPDVPLVVTVGGVPLGTVRTDENGEFEFSKPLPANVSDGTPQLAVRPANRGRAVTADTATSTVHVATTKTKLNASATVVSKASDRTVRVEGRLETDDGDPVADQQVVISVNGSRLGTVQTTANGAYSLRTTVPRGVAEAGGTVTVVAAYRGTDTNLQSSRATTSVDLPSSDESTQLISADPESIGIDLWLVGALMVAVALGTGAWTARRFRAGDETDSVQAAEFDEPTERADASEDIDGSDSDDGEASESPLERARSSLDAGRTDDAVESAYETVRRRLEERFGISTNTHRECYEVYRTRLDETPKALYELVYYYERAAYGPVETTPESARTSVEAAASVLDELERT